MSVISSSGLWKIQDLHCLSISQASCGGNKAPCYYCYFCLWESKGKKGRRKRRIKHFVIVIYLDIPILVLGLGISVLPNYLFLLLFFPSVCNFFFLVLGIRCFLPLFAFLFSTHFILIIFSLRYYFLSRFQFCISLLYFFLFLFSNMTRQIIL